MKRLAGMCTLVAGLALGSGVLDPTAGAEPDGGETGVLVVRGRIAATDGEPVAGAEVGLYERRTQEAGPAAAPRAVTSSREDGGFLLRAEAGRWTLLVHEPGHPSLALDLDSASGDLRVPTAVLPPSRSRRVLVVDSDGEPVAGATVAAHPTADAGPAGAWYPAPFRGETGDRGRLDLPWDGRPWTVQSVAPKHARSAPVVVRASGRGDALVHLVAGRVPYGRITDLEGRGLDGVAVSLDDGAERSRSTARSTVVEALSGPGGEFVLPPVDRGRYRLTARAAGRAAAVVPGLASPAEPRPWDLGVLSLAPGGGLEGRIVDEEGVAIAEAPGAARFDERTEAASHAYRPRPFETDGDGGFRLSGLPERGLLTLDIRAPGFRPTARTIALPALEPGEIVLERGARIAGRVVDETGEPVPAAMVSASLLPPEDAADTAGGAVPGPLHTASDDDGRFLFDGLPPGVVEISAGTPGGRRTEPTTIELEAGEEIRDLRLELPAELRLTGTVSGPGGPLADAVVELSSLAASRPSRGRARTGPDGAFVLEGVEPGPSVLSAHRSGYRPLHRRLTLSGEPPPLDLVLEPGAEIRGSVLTGDGGPVAGALVTPELLERFAPEDGAAPRFPPPSARSDGHGRFHLSGLETGRYRLTAARPGLAPRLPAVEVEVLDAGVSGVQIELQAATTIRGRIRGLDLDGLARAEVVVFCPPDTTALAQPDFAGRFRLANLPACTWRVAARSGGRSAHATAETSAAVPTAWVELDLDAAAGDPAPQGRPTESTAHEAEAGRDRPRDL